MGGILGKLLKAALEALLGFWGERQNKQKSDDAQREAGARKVEAEANKGAIDEMRKANEIRDRELSDAEQLDRLRPPAARRGKHNKP